MTAPATGELLVALRNLPVALFEASSHQWGDLLRDYLFRGLGGADQPYGVDDIGRSVAALDLVRRSVAAARSAAPAAERLDVDVNVLRASSSDFAILQGALDHARQLAVAGEMLAPPALPEVVIFRDWFCDEVLDQSAGAVPRPWEFVPRIDAPVEVELAEWDPAIAPGDTEPWLVADDHHRIIGASTAALELLGWSRGGLVGQRLLAVIPDRFRELHVAGFTRSVVTGEHRLLGVALSLPALARDGTEIPITLTLTRHPAKRGRLVYLGRLQPDLDAASAQQ